MLQAEGVYHMSTKVAVVVEQWINETVAAPHSEAV
jgi:hypothetical protein